MWIVIGALGAIAVAVLLAALLRRPAESLGRAEHDLVVFRAQLSELEREAGDGSLGKAEAESARVEIQRRMLAAGAAQNEGVTGPATDGRLDGALAVAVAVAVPAAALGLYLWLGAPVLGTAELGKPTGAATTAAAMPDIEAMVEGLEKRLAEAPDDLRGWVMLARSTAVLGRYHRAIQAFDRAIALKGDVAELHAGRGEVLVVLADGQVGEEARAAFARARALDPSNARARYYTAIAMAQDGRARDALDGLIALLRDAPPDAAWASAVRGKAVELAGELGVDPSSLPTTGAAARPPAMAQATGPTAEAAREIAAMSEADRREQIKSMVAGLARRLKDSPDDLNGWRMLARSLTVLGESEKAERAYRQLLELDGNDADALYRLGDAARLRGDSAEAERLWGRLLAQLTPGATDHAELKSQIEGLKGD